MVIKSGINEQLKSDLVKELGVAIVGSSKTSLPLPFFLSHLLLFIYIYIYDYSIPQFRDKQRRKKIKEEKNKEGE